MRPSANEPTGNGSFQITVEALRRLCYLLATVCTGKHVSVAREKQSI
jgi:hypothetical protein